MGSSSNVVIDISDSGDENEPKVYTKELVHPEFEECVEKGKQEGYVDPDYALYCKLIGALGYFDPEHAKKILQEEQNKQVVHDIPASNAKKLKNKEAAEDASHEGLLFRGPREDFLAERRNFDRLCEFGNDMHLTKKQQDWLDSLCVLVEGVGTKLFSKFFVHRMTHSNVIDGKCKMDIGAKFSKRYLQSKVTESGVMVPVISKYSEEKMNIKMMRGMGKNNATMTSGWGKAVKELKISENDIWIFNFGTDLKGDLDLQMMRLPPSKE